MEMALVKFIGSGVAAVSSGLGFTVPASAIRRGFTLVDYLMKYRAVETGRLLEDFTKDLWANWGQGQVPHAAALKQLQGLPIILSNHCPPPNYFVSGLENAAFDTASGKLDTASGGRLIAAEVIMRGRETNAFEKAGLNEGLCYFLMERLFTQLLLRFQSFEEMKPMLQSYFLQKLWRETLSDETQAAIGQTAHSNDQVPAEGARHANRDVKSAGQLLDPISHIKDKAAFKDDIEGMVDPEALEAAVAHFEALMDNESNADARTLHQLQLGRLHKRIGTQTEEIKVLEDASSLLKDGLALPLLLDKAGIRRKAQIDLAELLWNLSSLRGDRMLAKDAAATLEPVCQLLRATGDLSIWVKTHTLLATIYQGLSREQSGVEYLEQAARYLEKAAERLSRNSQPVEWATVANRMSNVLELMAIRTTDFDQLTQAAEVKAAAIDVFEVHGDSDLLETLRDELYGLHDQLQRLSLPEPVDEAMEALSKSA